jgi:hypothetical protein
MTNFKEEIQELKRISDKIALYQNTREEYKIVPLADLLLTISNSIKDKYNEKYPGRLKNVNTEIHMEKFEDYSKGNFIRLEDVGLENDLPSNGDWAMEDLDYDEPDFDKPDFESQSNSSVLDEFAEFGNEKNEEAEDLDEISDVGFDQDIEDLIKEESFIEEVKEVSKREEFKTIQKEIKFESEAINIAEEPKKHDLYEKEDISGDDLNIVDVFGEEDKKAECQENKLELEKINTLNFLYKPILKENYLEGNYLATFGIKRNADLEKSGALEMHNKFWSANSVEHGNIFGSVPIDLIEEKSANVLLGKGWRIAEVDIYELKCELDLWETNKYCKVEFENYLVVKEVGGDTVLIFDYKI